MTREEKLDWLYRLRSEIYVFMPKEWIIPMNNALDMAIKNLEQEPAHWTADFTCSNCGCKCYPMDIDFGDYNYCPNCGREMEEGD